MERKMLKKGQMLLLCEDKNNLFKRKFTIVKVISAKGSSVICYEAYHENSGKGILKEFYPQDAYGVERKNDGQLIHSEEFKDAHERYSKAEREYIEPYEMLLSAKKSDKDKDLSTFIPAFEIYHGCDENGEISESTYIWTPDPELETFDKVCDDVHRHPKVNPEHKLVTVLSAVQSLTKCICALHSAEMLHRDIKPTNFGFLKRNNETLTQTISMFDINTICSVYASNQCIVGTEGYMEPEAQFEDPTNQTDIYSIGATLFNAIIVTDETKKFGYCYKGEYYEKLHELVQDSQVISASEANSHPRLRNILVDILKKCLCDRPHRYPNCEMLLEDLEMALYYALPSEIAKSKKSSAQWILTDAEKSLDVNIDKNSFLSIQYHLYEYPLYRFSPVNDEKLNVLVLGFGNYGQKFLDACIQNGQIINKKLNVIVVSDDATDKDIYLADRPELRNFFNIDGSVDDECSYGKINFLISALARANENVNADIVQNIMLDRYEQEHLDYIFIALGDDSLNKSAASACKIATGVLEHDSIISYVCESEVRLNEEDNVYPVFVNKNIKESDLNPEIERMAFNTHLIWEKSLNVDYKQIRAEYRKSYNHASCVSNVLSLKYKLYSVGIDIDKMSLQEAARRFQILISDKSNKELKDKLIWIEHRRWVTEKLCLGWRKLDRLEDCLGGVTKDEKNKRHVCIVRSEPNQKLTQIFKKNGNYDKWDSATIEEIDQFDELDRLSIDLHRLYVSKAAETRKYNLLSGNSMEVIRSLIEGNKKSLIAYQEWFSCLKDIWNGDTSKVNLYKGLKNAFLTTVNDISDERRNAIQNQVNAFENMFYPVLASMQYRDWKQDDIAFIDNILFVLTYTENSYLVVPFDTGDNTRIFNNVAAATVVNPSRIIYLYYAEKKYELEELEEGIRYVAGYMKKKHVKAVIELVLAYDSKLGNMINLDFSDEIGKLSSGKIKKVKLIRLTNTSTDSIGRLSEELEEYLVQRKKGKRFFALEKNSTKLSYMLYGTGTYSKFSSYKFDSNTMKFYETSECDMLGYINKTPYITVTDMAAFCLSSSESSNQPEFFNDYKELWTKYSLKSSSWKSLCSILSVYAEKNDVLEAFKKKKLSEKAIEIMEYHYILPFECIRSIEKILSFLKKQEVIEKNSCVHGYTTDSCEVIIEDGYNNKGKFDSLFANVYFLMHPKAIKIHLNIKSHEIIVSFDSLLVKNLQIPSGKMQECTELLEYFKEKRYVINLTSSQSGTVSFTYATRQIKELLTTAGKMLEIYTYHKIKELGKFDDVVSSFEIDWEETDVKSEFDCILTKGFKTLFVECKARPDIEQEFYYKLSSLAQQFGINATAVLIADTQEKSYYDSASINSMQRKRGSMMNVVTIWKTDEIKNIGHTLLKIINGKYVSEEK